MVHYAELRNVIDQYFRGGNNRLVKHHLDSFDYFIHTLLPQIAQQYNSTVLYGNYNEEKGKHEVEIHIKFGDVALQPPMIHENNGSVMSMTPEVARLRNLTYSSNLHIDIDIETVIWKGENLDIREQKSQHWDKILIGKIPIMVKSKYCSSLGRPSSNECIFDVGGYFVITGSEKVIISQERQAENKTFCFKNIGSTKFTHVVEVKSVPKKGFLPAKTTTVKIASKTSANTCPLYVLFQGCRKEIPLALIFRSLGVLSDREMSHHILGHKDTPMRRELVSMLQSTFEEAETNTTQPMALEAVSKCIVISSRNMTGLTPDKKIALTREALVNDLLPHLGDSFENKVIYLAQMTRKLLLYATKRITEDDRDSFENKRVDTPGIMLGNLFRQSFTKLMKDTTTILTKEMNNGVWKLTGNFHSIINANNIYKIIKSNIIETNMKYSLATGNWGIKNATAKVGVAQVLQRLSYLGTLSHLRRVNTPIDKTSKMVKPRKLHASTFGYICPSETPEGPSVGLVKNLALSSTITITKVDKNIRRILLQCENVTPYFSFENDNDTALYMNGDIVGWCSNMLPIYNKLRDLRRRGIIHGHTALVPNYAQKEFHVYTTGGRLIRPLFIVHKNTLVFQKQHIEMMKKEHVCWEKLVHGSPEEGLEPAIEFIDVQESNTIMVCDHVNHLHKPKGDRIIQYTHCEIDPSLILGVLASNIPFSDHNQSPRNTYQCLDRDELILMDDGSYKPIGNILVGERVMTFDPEKCFMFPTKVTHQMSGPTHKSKFEITTLNEKKIVATYDHKFMTHEGWCEIGNLNVNSLIATYPHERLTNDETTSYSLFCGTYNTKPNIALEESTFIKVLEICGYDHESNLKTFQLARDQGFFPFYTDNPLLPELARIMGHDFLYLNKNHELALEELDAYITKHNIQDLLLIDNKQAIIGLLSGLGFCVYKENCHIPRWVREGSPNVIKAFLSGLQGRYASPISAHQMNQETYFYWGGIECAYRGDTFTNQLKKLYTTLGINITHVYKRKELSSQYNTQNTTNTTVFYYATNTLETLITIGEHIGYSGNTDKRMKSAIILEYLRVKVSISFEDWCQKVIVQNECLFVPVKSKKKIYDKREIADITTESDTHCFVTASGFAVHNSAMGKQAMGIYSSKYNDRMDTLSNILWYPTTQLVMTHNSRHMNMDKNPNGTVVIIAVCSAQGYNQEDSLMFNRSSIERGLFRSSFFRTYHVEEKKNQSTGEEEQFAKPDPLNTIRMRACTYDTLDDNGFPKLNKKVRGGDAIIGKTVPLSKKRMMEVTDKDYRDNSVYLRPNEDGVVDNVFTSRNGDGYVFCKVKIRSERKPEIGDKFSSFHGQKGTIGMIYDAQDMPYTKDGLVPDIIMNPHAFPSRMTFAQLLESLLGSECIYSGMIGDGTPFTDITIESISKRLEARGFDAHGEMELYAGETGKKLKTSVFMGPVFYQRLKHMVEDKIHARSTGPIVNLTRQPSEGRARDGGLRVGEMERDAMISHGASQFIREKMMELSDCFTIHTNKKTGFMCAANKKDNIYNSFSNDENGKANEIVEHRVPYALKLMIQELQTMGVAFHFQS